MSINKHPHIYLRSDIYVIIIIIKINTHTYIIECGSMSRRTHGYACTHTVPMYVVKRNNSAAYIFLCTHTATVRCVTPINYVLFLSSLLLPHAGVYKIRLRYDVRNNSSNFNAIDVVC